MILSPSMIFYYKAAILINIFNETFKTKVLKNVSLIYKSASLKRIKFILRYIQKILRTYVSPIFGSSTRTVRYNWTGADSWINPQQKGWALDSLTRADLWKVWLMRNFFNQWNSTFLLKN